MCWIHFKRTSAGMKLSYHQIFNIYLYNYPTETAILIATPHEKTLMADI